MNPVLLTKSEVANVLKVTIRTVDNLIYKGYLQAIRLADTPRAAVRIEASQLMGYIKGRKGYHPKQIYECVEIIVEAIRKSDQDLEFKLEAVKQIRSIIATIFNKGVKK